MDPFSCDPKNKPVGMTNEVFQNLLKISEANSFKHKYRKESQEEFWMQVYSKNNVVARVAVFLIDLSLSDSCINNVKLSLNCTKDYNTNTNNSRSYPYIHAQSEPCLKNKNCDPSIKGKVSGSQYGKNNDTCNQNYSDLFYRKNPSKLSRTARTSLDNVSVNPWGGRNSLSGDIDEHSSLRRSRSLAISGEHLYSREDFYTNQQEEEQSSGRKRSQLIPRAKLIKEHNRFKNLSADNLNKPPEKPERLHSRRNSVQTLQELRPQESLYFDRYRQQHKSDNFYAYTSLQNIHENSNPHDSLDSNFNNKSSAENIYTVSYEDLPELSLPNYYPDVRYDTDNTDNISLTDNISSLSLDNISKYKDIKFEKSEYESISYDENIVLTPNKNLYESQETKPRTIRNPTPYNENYGTVNPKSTKSSEVVTQDKPVEEIDTNLDEINLNIENITKIDDNISDTPKVDVTHSVQACEGEIKTLLEVPGEESANEKYKTVVTVDSIDDSCKETKTHSHNYLREFLETQKGSRKPLQNFIAKKLSNLSRKTSKTSNLSENQFHSLPDITISKNLRKCEKIDRKLRKCNKNQATEGSRENRFIVNIGRHFDITANDHTPVDFEVKIAKVPKKIKKNLSTVQTESEFIEAVKQLKDSLNENNSINRTIGTDKEMALLYCQDECSKELQEKIGTMKDYWNKMMGKENDIEENEVDKCKVVEITAKVDDVRKVFEPSNDPAQEQPPNKVQLAKQIFEPKTPEVKSGKISPNIKESCSYFENKTNNFYNDKYQSLCPNSVEIIHTNNDTTDSAAHRTLRQSHSINGKPEFDHVRYKLVKSDLFQKKIFANCEKESEFDDLIQYLQDYSFQELLVDNNIVIIEPIRSKVPYEPSPCVKNMKNVTTSLRNQATNNADNKSSMNRKFFYHPIRVNKEVNEDELPSPDTVRQVRQLFEKGTLKTNSQKTNSTKETDTCSIDPDKDRCSATDTNSHPSNISDFGSQENLYDSIDNKEIYCEYVSEDILQKIRDRGTTVTYYGGRVVDKKTGQSVLTKSIMDEIKYNEKRCMECPNCKKHEMDTEKDAYTGVKFKLLKSNSCSSRLELVGTETKKKFAANNKNIGKNVTNITNTDKNAINESIKKQTMVNNSQPKIIGEEMKVPENKVTQWKEISEKNQKIYNFYEYDNTKEKSRKIEDMEFEPYEVA
ncbi:unnamed protein product [Diabrotica balteata]|uniref:Uncharacterized protein n=1 Tax=Diabrotica balteata TaxID=107213 RepID=A0A9N9T7R2_DIABA|nr:unnamed protein product [Diabrotica balteata]